MKRERVIWSALLLAAAVALLLRAAAGHMPPVQIVREGDAERELALPPRHVRDAWTKVVGDHLAAQTVCAGLERGTLLVIAESRAAADALPRAGQMVEQLRSRVTDVELSTVSVRVAPLPHVSWGRTVGVWIAAFFTLCILSFLYRDNVFYKLAEHIFVGVSAAYWMVVNFWTTLVPNLVGKLAPALTRRTLMPGLDRDAEPQWVFLLPLAFSVLLLMRLSRKAGWLSRWSLAFILGTTAGLRLVGFVEADFLSQIKETVDPFISVAQRGAAFNPLQLLNALIILIGTLCGLTYFFFSVEHKGLVGRAARVGIWVLMITFGVGFGFTVMGRIALLVGRFEFLLEDWLHIGGG